MIKYFFLSVLLIPFLACAGVIPERTRIVYDSESAFQSYVMKNTNQYPVIVQFWVDNGEPNKNPETTPSPFVVTPVMVRMDPSMLSSIRVIYSGEGKKLPDDRESLYFLNILEIPPMSRNTQVKNEIALSMQTQIKLIYRPNSLKLGQNELIDKLKALRFSGKKDTNGILQLTVDNPTPYTASFSTFQIVAKDNGKMMKFTPPDNSDLTVLPKSQRTFAIDIGKRPVTVSGLEYWLIDDLGKFIELKSSLAISNS